MGHSRPYRYIQSSKSVLFCIQVESGEGEEELAAPPPDYPGNAEDSEEEARENEEAINAVVSAVEDKEESSEREANDAQSSHNTSSHSAQGSQEDKENRGELQIRVLWCSSTFKALVWVAYYWSRCHRPLLDHLGSF